MIVRRILVVYIIMSIVVCIDNVSYCQILCKAVLVDYYSNDPISNATIVYKITDKSGDQLYKGYDITNDRGTIELGIYDKNKFIDYEIRHITYQVLKKKQSVYEFPDTIYMYYQDVKLDEIVVSHSRENKQDNIITFEVDSSKNIRTRRFTRLLNNTPGFEVNKSGIKYKKKLIETVLIDSMDISGSQYMDVVDALKSDFFKTFQIIKEYHRNPVNKEFEKGKMALNIQSKDLSKLNMGVGLSGTLDSRMKNDLKGDFFVNTKHVKTIGMFQRNQINHEYLSITSLKHGPKFYRSDFGISDWRSEILLSTPYLLMDRYQSLLFDETYSGTKLLTGIHTKAKGDHRFALHYGNNDFKQSQSNFFEQNYLEGKWKYQSTTNIKMNSQLYGLEYQFEKPGTKSYLNFGGHYLVPSYTSTFYSDLSGDINELLSHGMEEKPRLRLGAFMAYSEASGNQSKHDVNIEFNIGRRDEYFYPDSIRISNFFSTSNYVVENLFEDNHRFKGEYKYSAKMGLYTGALGARIEHKFRSGVLRWKQKYQSNELISDAEGRNQKYLLILDLFPRNTISMSHWIGLNFRSGYEYLNIVRQGASINEQQIPVELKLVLGKRIKNWNVLNLNYRFQKTYPELTNFHPDNTINSYYNNLIPLREWKSVNNHNIRLGYNIGGIARLTNYRFMMEYEYSPNHLSENKIVFIDYAKSDYFYSSREVAQFNGKTKGMLLNNPLSYDMGIQARYGKYFNIINNQRVPLLNFSFRTEIGLQWKSRYIDIGLSAKIKKSISEIEEGNRFSYITTDYDFELTYDSDDKKWNVTWCNSFRFRNFNHLQFPGGKFFIQRFFSNFDISCWISNLYNANYEVVNITPLTENIFNIPLNPRSLGLRVKWDI